MYNLDQIRNVHLEITSKCQARCPMCPRRINGGILNPLFDLNEIDLNQFKSWFSVKFIAQLDSLFMCGNLGDPIIAQDTLGIFQYIRSVNPSIKLTMHTNGSARDSAWWTKIAQARVKVTFGIDGLADTHSLYRIGTDWHKIIHNAQAFIAAGGIAEWHMLAFKHNEHEIDDCKNMSDELGFASFNVKHTSRFVDNQLTVIDDAGRTSHIIHPTDRSVGMIAKVKEAKNTVTSIECKAQKYQQLYIAADGTVSPCCWLDFSWQLPNNSSRVNYMDVVGVFPNLNTQSLEEIFDLGYFQTIENTWAVKPLTECSRQCGKFDKLGEQFNGNT